jgi:hypothetical protein
MLISSFLLLPCTNCCRVELLALHRSMRRIIVAAKTRAAPVQTVPHETWIMPLAALVTLLVRVFSQGWTHGLQQPDRGPPALTDGAEGSASSSWKHGITDQ